MAESLFDQLKKSGLVNDQKAKQAQKAKGKAQFLQTKQKKTEKKSAPVDDAVAKAAREKAERARQLNLERQQQQVVRAARAEVRQIIESNRLERFEGPIAYHFTDGRTVKTLAVNQLTHRRLMAAEVRIVRQESGQESGYALLPAEAAARVEQRDRSALIAVPGHKTPLSKEEQAYYARFEVPEDLMW